MKRLLVLLLLLAPLMAQAQLVTTGLSVRPVLLFQSTSLVGNGADTTEDTLFTTSLAPSQLANAGDVLHVVARGLTAATTDTKTLRMKVGAATICSFNSVAVGNTFWLMEAWTMKNGANSQSTVCLINNANNNTYTTTVTSSVTDTSALTLSVTGQNNTTSSANSIQGQQMMAWYLPGN